MQHIKIGTRGSTLALRQAEVAQNIIKQNWIGKTEIIKIKTSGDIIKNRSLAEIGGKGLFLKEIELALLDKRIDIAVHSMKDIPAFFHNELMIAGILKRNDPRDAFISNSYQSLQDLPLNSTIGTCAPRKIAQLRSDIKTKTLRGNVNTRLKQINNFDGIILAVAGLQRLNICNKITEILPPEVMLPAVGQGVICIQCRKSDLDIVHLLNKITHPKTKIAMLAERSFLEKINGDCTTPLAALAEINKNELRFRAMLAQDSKIHFTEKFSTIDNATKIGTEAATELLDK